MIFSDIQQIIDIIKKPKNSDLIKRGIELKEKHSLHVAGIGLHKFLNKIQGIENEQALSVRKALAREATVAIYSKALKPKNKVFSARGGTWLYNFNNDRDRAIFENNILNNVNGEYSMNEYMSNIWSDMIDIDPMGLAFLEVDNNETYITYKSITDIYDIDFNSFRDINYIIFNPVSEKHKLKYRVVDDAFDYTIVKEGNKFYIDEAETYPNYFGKVPAVMYSNRDDKKSNGKTSYIEESLYLADSYLLDYTIYTIYKLKQGIPYVYEYERDCPVCKGLGVNEKGENCDHCEGTGKAKNRDVSDVIILPIPRPGEEKLIPPAGYVQPDLETWKQQESTLQYTESQIYEAIWGGGSYVNKDRQNTTAFEVSVRKEPEHDKLNLLSQNAEQFEKSITDLFARFYFPFTYKDSVIVYGRRYNLKSVDEIWKLYQDGLNSNISSTLLDEILKEYYYSLYENNQQKLDECLLKLATKPFFHYKPDTLISLNVPRIDYLKNIYYDQFVNDYEQTKWLYLSTIDEIKKALDIWIQPKIENQTSNDLS